MDIQKNLHIMKAESEDLGWILNLQYLAYQSEAKLCNNYDIPPLKQTLKEIMQEFENGLILKAYYKKEEIIGSIRGIYEGDTVKLGKLMVHPAYQHKGLGTKLLTKIEDLMVSKRYELFTSSYSNKNILFYIKNGYETYKEEKINDDLTLIYLQKNC